MERWPTIARKPLRFVIVGVWNTVFAWVAYWALLHLFGAHYLWATVPTFVLATTNGWFFQRRFVFGTAADARVSYLRFMAVQLLYLAVGVPLLALLVHTGLPPALANVFSTGCLAVASYLAHDRFTFRAHPAAQPPAPAQEKERPLY